MPGRRRARISHPSTSLRLNSSPPLYLSRIALPALLLSMLLQFCASPPSPPTPNPPPEFESYSLYRTLFNKELSPYLQDQYSAAAATLISKLRKSLFNGQTQRPRTPKDGAGYPWRLPVPVTHKRMIADRTLQKRALAKWNSLVAKRGQKCNHSYPRIRIKPFKGELGDRSDHLVTDTLIQLRNAFGSNWTDELREEFRNILVPIHYHWRMTLRNTSINSEKYTEEWYEGRTKGDHEEKPETHKTVAELEDEEMEHARKRESAEKRLRKKKKTIDKKKAVKKGKGSAVTYVRLASGSDSSGSSSSDDGKKGGGLRSALRSARSKTEKPIFLKSSSAPHSSSIESKEEKPKRALKKGKMGWLASSRYKVLGSKGPKKPMEIGTWNATCQAPSHAMRQVLPNLYKTAYGEPISPYLRPRKSDETFYLRERRRRKKRAADPAFVRFEWNFPNGFNPWMSLLDRNSSRLYCYTAVCEKDPHNPEGFNVERWVAVYCEFDKVYPVPLEPTEADTHSKSTEPLYYAAELPEKNAAEEAWTQWRKEHQDGCKNHSECDTAHGEKCEEGGLCIDEFGITPLMNTVNPKSWVRLLFGWPTFWRALDGKVTRRLRTLEDVGRVMVNPDWTKDMRENGNGKTVSIINMTDNDDQQ